MNGYGWLAIIFKTNSVVAILKLKMEELNVNCKAGTLFS